MGFWGSKRIRMKRLRPILTLLREKGNYVGFSVKTIGWCGSELGSETDAEGLVFNGSQEQLASRIIKEAAVVDLGP